MREKNRPKPKKVSYYVSEELGQAYFEFTHESPSEEIAGALLTWMALDSLSHEDRRMIQEIALHYPDNPRVARAKVLEIIRRGVIDGVLLDHARSQPVREKMKVLRTVRQR